MFENIFKLLRTRMYVPISILLFLVYYVQGASLDLGETILSSSLIDNELVGDPVVGKRFNVKKAYIFLIGGLRRDDDLTYIQN